MKFVLRTALYVVLATAAAAAQKTTQIHPGRGGSPHVRADWTIANANISIEYGRPYLKGRTVGKELVPFGSVWRAGADEATTLTSNRPLAFGALTVPAGSHTLWVLPAANTWHLIVNKNTGQWGTEYDEKGDIGRVEMKLEQLSTPVEQHTISIDQRSAGGLLKIEFGAYRATTPFTVK